MRLIFIRHAEPDYRGDVLTQRGVKEANILSERVKNWEVDRVYCSPLGRAVATAAPSLKALGMEAITLPWLREFSHPIINPTHKGQSVCWDFAPSAWADNPVMYTKSEWLDTEPAVQNPELKAQYEAATKGIDKILSEYGYERKGNYYKNVLNPKNRRVTSTVVDMDKHFANLLPAEDAGKTVVFFCHFGVTCLLLSHLVNIPFNALTHGTIIPTTGITIVNSEERWDDEVYFRIQTFGDAAHMLMAGEEISSAGSFTPLFTK